MSACVGKIWNDFEIGRSRREGSHVRRSRLQRECTAIKDHRMQDREIRWRIEMLGGLRVLRGDRAISHFTTRKAGALLAYLAFYHQDSHSREYLAEWLWP